LGGSTKLIKAAALAAALMLVAAATAGVPRMSEPASPQRERAGTGRLLVVAGAVWSLALIAASLAAVRNVRVVQTGGRSSWMRLVSPLISLILVLAALRFARGSATSEGYDQVAGAGDRFSPPDWLSRAPIGALRDVTLIPARSGAELALWLVVAAGAAILALSLVALLRPGVSLYSRLPGWPTGAGGLMAPARPTDAGSTQRRTWRGARLRIIESYGSVVDHLRSLGVPMRPSWTPREHLEYVLRMGLPQASPLGELERLFELARYSERPLSSDHARLAERLASAIRGESEEGGG